MLSVPTLGGKQLWADVMLHAGYRLQQNVLTGHHRLLDPADVRLATGSQTHCADTLARLRELRDIQPDSDHLVLLLHGFIRSKDVWGPMLRALRSHGFDAHGVNYPSTRRDLEQHADQVEGLLERVQGSRRVSFVTHSMGGMVARVLLSRPQRAWRRRIEVNRLVMIATPNQGAEAAAQLNQFQAVKALAGPALADLEPERAATVPIPEVKFGVIAGARGDGRGYNPMLPGDDDMTVSVASTRLDGAEDFLLVQALHTFIMIKPEVVRATIHYLRTGRFAPSIDLQKPAPPI